MDHPRGLSDGLARCGFRPPKGWSASSPVGDLCEVDATGSLSAVTSLGPFVIHLDRPTVTYVDTVGTIPDGTQTSSQVVS